VVEQQVLRIAGVGQLAIVDRQILETEIGRLDEDLGVVTRGAQHTLDAQHLVADGVSVTERGEYLMDRWHGYRSPLGRRRPRGRRLPCRLSPPDAGGV